MVSSSRVEIGFLLMMEMDIEKVPRANPMELATAFLYFRAMLGMEKVPLVQTMGGSCQS